MLQRLTVSNFRTFQEPATLVFDAQFSAIIGPNGAGKSSSVAALHLLYEGDTQEGDVEVGAVFDGVEFRMSDGRFYIAGEQVDGDIFRNRLPRIVFPNQQVLLLPREKSADVDVEQLRHDLKKASDAVTQQKRHFTQLKQLAELADNYSNAQKQMKNVQQESLCCQIRRELANLESRSRSIEEEQVKLGQIPVSQDIQKAQQMLNSVDTEILKLSFRQEQHQNESVELQPRQGKLAAQIQQLESKYNIIQNSIRQFSAKQQENQVLAVQVKARTDDLAAQIAKAADEQQMQLPDEFFSMRPRFQEQFSKELTLKKNLKESISSLSERLHQQEKKQVKAAGEKEQTTQKMQLARQEMQALQAERDHLNSQLEGSQRTIQEARDKREDSLKKIANLQSRLDECNEKITQLTQNSKMLQQQQRYLKIKAEFKQLFGQRFHGAVKDLLVASNPLDQAALSFATSGLQNAFVVDDFATAQTAIQQLRQMKEAPQQFIALSQLSEPREAHSNALVNAVKRTPAYDRLFAFVCRNTVLVLNGENAREVARQGGVRVVTRDCKMFVPSGALQAQIGGSQNASADAALDYSQLGDLQLKKADLEQKLQEFKSRQQACEVQIAQLQQVEISELQFRARQVDQKIDLAQLELIKMQQAFDQSQQVQTDCKQRISELQAEQEQQKAALEQQLALLEQIKLSFYDPIIKQLQISGQVFLQLEANLASNTLLALKKQLVAEQERLEVLQQNQYQSDINRFNAQAEQITTQMQQAKKDLSVISMRIQELNLETRAGDNTLLQLKAESEQHKQALALLYEQQSSQAQEAQRIEQVIANLQQQQQICKQALEKMLEKAYTEQIQLPSNQEQPRQLLEQFISQHIDVVEFLLRDYKIDLAFLEKLTVPLETRIAELQAQMVSLNAELNQNIDMSAPAKIEPEKRKLQELFDAQQARKQAYMSAVKMVAQSEEKQLQEYQRFLQKTEEQANVFYKQFTNGQGQISITSDAFNEFQILAIPPGDGSRQLEDLSGGEQALVQCSIALAHCAISGAKTIIFDEIDANLDANRIECAASGMRAISGERNIKIIAISHKPELCEHCGSICGVARRENEGARSWWVRM